MNQLNTYPHDRGDCYEIANWLAGRPINGPAASASEAAEAAQQIEAAGWTFGGYNEYGEINWIKPKTKQPVDPAKETK